MDKKYLLELKNIDTTDVANAIKKAVNPRMVNIPGMHLKGIIVAYCLYMEKKNSNVCMDSANEFLEGIDVTDDIRIILKKGCEEVWEAIVSLRKKYSVDQLLAFILFNNEYETKYSEECSTPAGISRLAALILDIQKSDNVLDLCSGKGNFLVEASMMYEHLKYTGIELNYQMNEIALIRANVLGIDASIVLNDALEYRNEEKVDKIFANYPFNIRTMGTKIYQETTGERLGLSINSIRGVSSDWLFNVSAIEQIKEDGKAVVLMLNGSAMNSKAGDREIRKYFVDHGLVESVIALPGKLFSSMSIPVTMMVLSRGNKSVRLVDARDKCVKMSRNNVLTDECIDQILKMLEKDGECSVEKTIAELEENDYVLSAFRYLIPQIKDGVKFDSLTKNITRGAQVKAADLDKLKSKTPTQYEYVSLANIQDGILSIPEGQYLKEIPLKYHKFCLKNNSIVMTKTGGPDIKTAVVQCENSREILATGNLIVIELDENQINPFFLQAFFASETGNKLLRSICAGSSLLTISLGALKELTIPVPSMEEQKTIANKYAAAMDDVILLRRRIERSIEKMNSLYDEEVSNC